MPKHMYCCTRYFYLQGWRQGRQQCPAGDASSGVWIGSEEQRGCKRASSCPGDTVTCVHDCAGFCRQSGRGRVEAGWRQSFGREGRCNGYCCRCHRGRSVGAFQNFGGHFSLHAAMLIMGSIACVFHSSFVSVPLVTSRVPLLGDEDLNTCCPG